MTQNGFLLFKNASSPSFRVPFYFHCLLDGFVLTTSDFVCIIDEDVLNLYLWKWHRSLIFPCGVTQRLREFVTVCGLDIFINSTESGGTEYCERIHNVTTRFYWKYKHYGWYREKGQQNTAIAWHWILPHCPLPKSIESVHCTQIHLATTSVNINHCQLFLHKTE